MNKKFVTQIIPLHPFKKHIAIKYMKTNDAYENASSNSDYIAFCELPDTTTIAPYIVFNMAESIEINTIVHEVTHVITHIFKQLGMNPLDSSGEQLAYYLGFIVEEILLFIDSNRKKHFKNTQLILASKWNPRKR